MRKELLNNGYVELIEHWGSDERIVESARMSTDKSFRGWGIPEQPKDEKFLAFLYDNHHMSPFEMCGMTIEVKAPIFVFREWHRHRTQSYNELSGRYTKVPNDNYIPTMDRILEVNQPTHNKQATSANNKRLELDDALKWQNRLCAYYVEGEALYNYGLEIGVAKELARLPVTVGRYSKMRASANLRNWLQFTALRSAPDAQQEIRVYSNAVLEMIKEKFPRTANLIGDKS